MAYAWPPIILNSLLYYIGCVFIFFFCSVVVIGWMFCLSFVAIYICIRWVAKKRGKNVRAIIAYCTKYSLRKMQLRQQPMLIRTLNWNKIKVKIKCNNTIQIDICTYCWFHFIAAMDWLLPLYCNKIRSRIG